MKTALVIIATLALAGCSSGGGNSPHTNPYANNPDENSEVLNFLNITGNGLTAHAWCLVYHKPDGSIHQNRYMFDSDNNTYSVTKFLIQNHRRFASENTFEGSLEVSGNRLTLQTSDADHKATMEIKTDANGNDEEMILQPDGGAAGTYVPCD